MFAPETAIGRTTNSRVPDTNLLAEGRMFIWTCILVRIVANPLSNVFQKVLTQRTANPLFIIGITHGLLSLVCLPLFFFLPTPSSEFWLNISLCALLAVGGNVLIVAALKRSDLSVLGPINAYKSVVSLVPGMIILGEYPGPSGLAGMALIAAGSYLLLDRDLKLPAQNPFIL